MTKSAFSFQGITADKGCTYVPKGTSTNNSAQEGGTSTPRGLAVVTVEAFAVRNPSRKLEKQRNTPSLSQNTPQTNNPRGRTRKKTVTPDAQFFCSG